MLWVCAEFPFVLLPYSCFLGGPTITEPTSLVLFGLQSQYVQTRTGSVSGGDVQYSDNNGIIGWFDLNVFFLSI